VKTNAEDRRDHLMARVTANSDAERTAAAALVTRHSTDETDVALLLDALGLIPAQGPA